MSIHRPSQILIIFCTGSHDKVILQLAEYINTTNNNKNIDNDDTTTTNNNKNSFYIYFCCVYPDLF